MNDLKPYAVFAEVVAAGSLSAAARRLGMSPSAVSQTLSGLERQAGVSLLHRSTRRIVLTEAGERCLPHCQRLLEAGRAAAACLEQARDAPQGELRIAAPLGFGYHLAPALAPVLAEWPQLRLSLVVDDALIDLPAARIDLALRVGPLPDSTWIARRLGRLETLLCASPIYIERQGQPLQIEDLPRHAWLALAREVERPAAGGNAPDEARQPLFSLELQEVSGPPRRLELPVRTTTSNQMALGQMCEQGMGIARLYRADVQRALQQGLLVQLLPQLRLPSPTLSLLSAGRDGEPAKLRVAVAALKRYFASLTASVPGTEVDTPLT